MGEGSRRSAFTEKAGGKAPNLAAELWGWIRHSKKWWLTPIVVAAVLLGVLMVLFATPLSPLLYTLF